MTGLLGKSDALDSRIREAVRLGKGMAMQTKTDHRAGKYLAFRLAQEEFAVQVQHLREILAVQEITAGSADVETCQGCHQCAGESNFGDRSAIEVWHAGN